jgi:hypothetical protein
MNFYTKQHQFYAGTDLHAEAKGAPADPLTVFGAAGRTGTPGVVSLTRSVTARTEPRDAAAGDFRSSLEETCPQLQWVKAGNPGCAP